MNYRRVVSLWGRVERQQDWRRAGTFSNHLRKRIHLLRALLLSLLMSQSECLFGNTILQLVRAAHR